MIEKKQKKQGKKRLRFYCELCKKQCNDANGFKCHTATEEHQRLLRLFAENQKTHLSRYNGQFHKGMLGIISTRYARSYVLMNTVYNEYISNPSHVHMNATSWSSLAGYTRFLASKGIVEAIEGDHGWTVRYIDSDPEAMKVKVQARLDEKAATQKDRAAQSEAEAARVAGMAAGAGVVEAGPRVVKVKKLAMKGKKKTPRAKAAELFD